MMKKTITWDVWRTSWNLPSTRPSSSYCREEGRTSPPVLALSADPFLSSKQSNVQQCRQVSPLSSFPWEPFCGQLPSATGCKQALSQSFVAPARTGSCLPLRLNSLHALSGVPRSSHTSLPDSPQIYSIPSHLRNLALSLLLGKLSSRVSNVSVHQSGQPSAVTF